MAILAGKLDYSPGVADTLATCLLCGLCREMCWPYVKLNFAAPGIDMVGVTRAMRQDLVEAGLAVEAYSRLASSLAENRNSYGQPQEHRKTWAEGLGIPTRGAETMFFFGCTAGYQAPEIAQSTAKILRKAGVDFGILEEEWCCGAPALQTGYMEQAREHAVHNIDSLKAAGARTVVFSCAECYHSFKKDYPEMAGSLPFELIHISEYLAHLLKEGKIKLGEEIKAKVTYHDPCYLARNLASLPQPWMRLSDRPADLEGKHGIIDQPRTVLSAIPGLELVEMYPTRRQSWCCGSGGRTVKEAFPDLALDIAEDKLKLAQEAGASKIVSTCPMCKTNLADAIKRNGFALEAVDLTELVAQSLGA
jgi:heterodisulfide reductase subunit D